MNLFVVHEQRELNVPQLKSSKMKREVVGKLLYVLAFFKQTGNQLFTMSNQVTVVYILYQTVFSGMITLPELHSFSSNRSILDISSQPGP